MALKMNEDELNAFLKRTFPEAAEIYRVEAATEDAMILRLLVNSSHLRPGGTISGPSMFGLADVAMYAATLARIGPKALAVTTNCSIDFIRKPEANKDLLATAQVLKSGRQLVVGDVLIRSEGSDAVVARASLTYSIPPQGSSADAEF